MGARESRSQREADEDGDNDNGIGASQDYYAILEVDENASADEIRVSFPSPVPRSLAVPGCPGPACLCLRDADLSLCAALLRFVCMLIEIFFGLLHRDSVRSDVSRSYIIPTRIRVTLRVRPGASPRCSKRMRYVRLYYHIDVDVSKSGVRGQGFQRKIYDSSFPPPPTLIPDQTLL
jgi:hypothetical protein